MVCVSIVAYSLLRTTSYSCASSASYAIYAYSLLRTTSYKIWITHSLFFKSFNILLHIFHFFENTFSNLSISPTLYLWIPIIKGTSNKTTISIFNYYNHYPFIFQIPIYINKHHITHSNINHRNHSQNSTTLYFF